MIRHFSQDPALNPGGWQGEDWNGLGYDIISFFPEFDDPDCDEFGYWDRALTVTNSGEILDTVCFSSCTDCDDECIGELGDINNDANWNILDVVILANCVVAENCPPL